jgi:hypothetical protein
MGRVSGTYGGRGEVHAAVGWGNLTEKGHFEDLEKDERIKLY